MTPQSIILWMLAPSVACVVSVLLYVFHAYAIQIIAPEINQEAMLRVSAIANFYSFSWLIARVINAVLMRKESGKRKRPKLLRDLISATAFTVATVAAIGLLLGQSAGGVLASSGLVIAILGFAIRNVLADVLSGVAIGLEAPFRIGDWVEFDANTKGRVIEIGWRTTRVLTQYDTYMILPNSQISRLMLTNYSAPRKHYQARLKITLGHDISIARGKQLLLEAAIEASSTVPAAVTQKPIVRATVYDAEGVTYTIKYWVPSFADDNDCRDAVLVAIDEAIRKHGLSPPPFSRVRLMAVGKAAEAAAESSVS